MMRYPDAMCFSRALLTELYSTRKNEEGSLYRIMIPESTSYWSEHSERVTIMSWALIAEIPRETRRRWGRWSPGVDEEYAVTTKRVVTAAQGNLASKIRAQYGITDFVDDKSVLNGFSLWLQTVYFKTVSESHQETMKIAPPMWGGLDAAPVQVVKKPLREPKQEEDDLVVLDSPTEVFSDDEGMDDVQPGDRFPLGTFDHFVSGWRLGERSAVHSTSWAAATGFLVCITGSMWWSARKGRRFPGRRVSVCAARASLRRRRSRRRWPVVRGQSSRPRRSPPQARAFRTKTSEKMGV